MRSTRSKSKTARRIVFVLMSALLLVLGLRTISEYLIAKPFSLIVKLEDCKGKGCIYEIVDKLTSRTCETHIILPEIVEKADYYYVRIVMEDNLYRLLEYSAINV